MDLIFILGVLGLYAVTHALILAVARLQSTRMNVIYAVSGLLTAALFVYLLYALVEAREVLT